VRGNVSYLYEAIIVVKVLCVLMTPTWTDQVVMKLSHTHLYGFSFGVVSSFRPHRLAGSVESSLGSLAATAYGEATRSIMAGQFGPVMCRIILCSVRRSNRCYWHSHNQATVAPERYKEGAHLRLTTVNTLVAKGILNFLSQYKYSASGISQFFGGFPKPSKSDY
jgi:hypothetical protein